MDCGSTDIDSRLWANIEPYLKHHRLYSICTNDYAGYILNEIESNIGTE